MIAGILLLSFCIDTSGNTLKKPLFYVLLVSLLLILLAMRNRLLKLPVIWVMAGGSFIKLCYILYTETWNRQHDVVAFGAGEGQAAYIEYILEHKRWPDFDPREIWGFFQPPLHHSIAAAWMWIQRKLEMSELRMQENIQVLTLCYMIIVMLLSYEICRELELKERGTLIAMLIVSFHPMFIMLSGSINNDALALCLCMAAVYITLLWYKKPTFGKIILMALSIGLAMFTKLSSVLVAPAVGALMIYSLIKNKNDLKKYILQFVVFGVIVFPIGLYWSIRNLLRFNMPINYIPGVGEQLEKTGIISRIFDIRIHSVYPSLISLGDGYDEYNTLVQLMKSSLFGEYNYGQVSSIINPFSIILFITAVVLALVSLYATIYMIFSKKSMMTLDRKLFLGLLYVGFTGGYLSFSLSSSNFSAEDFRYSALAIIIEAIFLGIWADESEDRTAKIILILCVIFAAASFGVYFLLGIYQ